MWGSREDLAELEKRKQPLWELVREGGGLRGRMEALGKAATQGSEPAKQDSECRQGRNQLVWMVKSTLENPLPSNI